MALQALPTYNKDGQDFVKHRAFILHIISKEDILEVSSQQFLREGDSEGNWLKSLCVHHVHFMSEHLVCLA